MQHFFTSGEKRKRVDVCGFVLQHTATFSNETPQGGKHKEWDVEQAAGCAAGVGGFAVFSQRGADGEFGREGWRGDVGSQRFGFQIFPRFHLDGDYLAVFVA